MSEINKIELQDNKIILGSIKENSVNFVNKNALGWRSSKDGQLLEIILLKNNLHCRILINENDAIGKNDPANISDILLESAISSILDCEDSVATVDADDKILAYQNWLGLTKGNLEAEFVKNNKTVKRVLNKDIIYTATNQKDQILRGRSLC